MRLQRALNLPTSTESSTQNLLPYYTIPRGHPALALTKAPFGRPEGLLVDWIDDLHVLANYLCD
jgi:hypothetical protein